MFHELAINCSNFSFSKKGRSNCAGRRISIRKGGEAMGPLAGSVVTCAYDANGNITEYVSGSGEILSHCDYSAFGRELVQSGSDDFIHRFSTKPLCHKTGMLEYQLRKYRPWCGRWMNRDPIEEKKRVIPENMYEKFEDKIFLLSNMYSYCRNNVSNMIDIWGVSECLNKNCEPCDDEYKWTGTVTVGSLTFFVGVSVMTIDLKSNIVCGDCVEHHLQSTVILGTLSLGAPISLTGSEIEFGNYHPDEFLGSIWHASAGIGAMSVVEGSVIRIGNAVSISPIGVSGGASLGVSGSIGRNISFQMKGMPYGR